MCWGSKTRMDWAKTVKVVRKRLNMNQETFAGVLGISQTTVSRLESGAAEPTDDIQHKLEVLRTDPRMRSVFDDFVAAIRLSPYASFLIQPEDSVFRLEAVSPLMTQTLGDTAETLNQVKTAGDLVMHLDALLSRGFEAGRIDSATGVWADGRDPQGYWKVVYSPMRDGTGSWFIFAALTTASAADYEQHRAQHDGGLAVTAYSRETQA